MFAIAAKSAKPNLLKLLRKPMSTLGVIYAKKVLNFLIPRATPGTSAEILI